MAKTTKTTTGAAKPASRRKTAPAPAAGTEKVTTRRRTKSSSDSAQPLATADSRPARFTRRTKAAPAAEPTHDEIAIRAYYVYQRRVGRPGSPDQDWQQAVVEIRRERGLV
jgi:hypothetical protein